jgi:Na+-translocating ferredoxin:NAD+ oxidoreductase RnfD subunit
MFIRKIDGVTLALVLVALVPGAVAHVWFFGPGLIVQLLLAVGFALGCAHTASSAQESGAPGRQAWRLPPRETTPDAG